ncbi:MAG TPA: helix-turn-helix transcriptional regulator [Urbifossiella sp.]|nr:helix-turn-helix transcriptional regulator [Urbifossiella sp.]
MTSVARERRIDRDFGPRLRAIREAAGMTQGDLAAAAGVGRVILNRYEAGKAEPSWSVIVALAAALEVSPNDFKSGGNPD